MEMEKKEKKKENKALNNEDNYLENIDEIFYDEEIEVLSRENDYPDEFYDEEVEAMKLEMDEEYDEELQAIALENESSHKLLQLLQAIKIIFFPNIKPIYLCPICATKVSKERRTHGFLGLCISCYNDEMMPERHNFPTSF